MPTDRVGDQHRHDAMTSSKVRPSSRLGFVPGPAAGVRTQRQLGEGEGRSGREQLRPKGPIRDGRWEERTSIRTCLPTSPLGEWSVGDIARPGARLARRPSLLSCLLRLARGPLSGADGTAAGEGNGLGAGGPGRLPVGVQKSENSAGRPEFSENVGPTVQ